MIRGAQGFMAAATISVACLVGCGSSGDAPQDSAPVPDVTPAAEVSMSNQGALLREMFDELELDVRWGDAVGGSPPPDSYAAATDGRVFDADGTGIEFFIQLVTPPSKPDPPDDGPLVDGWLADGSIRGGPMFMISPIGGSGDMGHPAPDQAESELTGRIANGLCVKFAGRECGEPEPHSPEDV